MVEKDLGKIFVERYLLKSSGKDTSKNAKPKNRKPAVPSSLRFLEIEELRRFARASLRSAAGAKFRMRQNLRLAVPYRTGREARYLLNK